MLGPSTVLRDPTMSVCTPSYRLIHLVDIGMYSRRVNNHKKEQDFYENELSHFPTRIL